MRVRMPAQVRILPPDLEDFLPIGCCSLRVGGQTSFRGHALTSATSAAGAAPVAVETALPPARAAVDADASLSLPLE
jgi:hypothetical protein